MPYMPSNFYPKNCAITDSDKIFLCTIDNYDIIDRAILRIYNYDTNVLIKLVELNDSNGTTKIYYSDTGTLPTEESQRLDSIGESSILPIKNGGTLAIDISGTTIDYPNRFYWNIEVFGKNYNTWISEGYIYKKDDAIYVSPNSKNAQGQYLSIGETKYFINTITPVYNESGLTKSNTSNAITVDKSLPNTDDNSQLYIQISGVEYKVSEINNTQVKIEGTIPESTVSQFYSIYRKYQLVTFPSTTVVSLSGGEFYEIYSCSIKSYDNYVTKIVTPSISFPDSTFASISVNSCIATIVASYNGNIDWSQWTLHGANIDYQTEKIFTNQLSFTYDMFQNDETYTLNLKIHDKRGYDIENSITLNVSYNNNASFKPTVIFDSNKLANKIDISGVEAVLGVSNNNNYNFIDDKLYVGNKNNITWSKSGVNPLEITRDNQQIFLCFKSDESFVGDLLTISFKNTENTTNDIVVNLSETQVILKKDNISSSENLYTNMSGNLLGNQTKNNDTYYSFVEDGDIKYNATKPYIQWSRVQSDNYNYVVLSIESTSQIKLSFLSNITGYEKKTLTLDLIDTNILSSNTITSISLNGNNTYDVLVLGDLFSNYNEITLQDCIDLPNKLSYQNKDIDFLTSFSSESLGASGLVIPADSTLEYTLVQRKNVNTNEIKNIARANPDTVFLYDYGIAAEDKYTYTITNIYKNNSGIYTGTTQLESNEIGGDWFAIDIYGTTSYYTENELDLYAIDLNNMWHFELDAKGSNITVNQGRNIYETNQALPKVNESNKNYLTGSITTKLGYIENDFLYKGDDIQTQQKFIDFVNNHSVKIIRFKNGRLIPVSIRMTSLEQNESVVGMPTDITFEWTQIGNIEKVSLVEESLR